MCMQRYEYSVRAGLRRGKWDEEEDLRLSEAVAFYQEAANAERSGKLGIPWSKVARHVPGRTDPQCRERWTGKLDPTLNNSEWTEEESQVRPRPTPLVWLLACADSAPRLPAQACCR